MYKLLSCLVSGAGSSRLVLPDSEPRTLDPHVPSELRTFRSLLNNCVGNQLVRNVCGSETVGEVQRVSVRLGRVHLTYKPLWQGRRYIEDSPDVTESFWLFWIRDVQHDDGRVVIRLCPDENDLVRVISITPPGHACFRAIDELGERSLAEVSPRASALLFVRALDEALDRLRQAHVQHRDAFNVLRVSQIEVVLGSKLQDGGFSIPMSAIIGARCVCGETSNGRVTAAIALRVKRDGAVSEMLIY